MNHEHIQKMNQVAPAARRGAVPGMARIIAFFDELRE
jgi:hypothetical protein